MVGIIHIHVTHTSIGDDLPPSICMLLTNKMWQTGSFFHYYTSSAKVYYDVCHNKYGAPVRAFSCQNKFIMSNFGCQGNWLYFYTKIFRYFYIKISVYLQYKDFCVLHKTPPALFAPTGFMQYKTSDIIARVASINAAKLRNMQYYSQYMQNSAERILRWVFKHTLGLYFTFNSLLVAC